MNQDKAAFEQSIASEPEQRPRNCGSGFCSCIECPFCQDKPAQPAYIHKPTEFKQVDADVHTKAQESIQVQHLVEALEKFAALIQYQYSGSKEAMSALQEADNAAQAVLEAARRSGL